MVYPLSDPVCLCQMGTLVLWGTPDVSFAVPLWVIILAILLGLLVLAMLTLVMWKVMHNQNDRRPTHACTQTLTHPPTDTKSK